MTAPPPYPLRQEPDQPRGRRAAALLFAGALCIVLAVLASRALMPSARTAEERDTRQSTEPVGRGSARLERGSIERTAAGIELMRAQRKTLETFAWIARDSGIASIPIERAMQIIVQQAAAERRSDSPAPSAGTATPADTSRERPDSGGGR
jgi:hypothetical protein